MEEEALKNFRFLHGKKTYRMAWIVEWCLFTLGISIAGFNILTGIFEGNLGTQILLAIGWVILGTIELSTIPLAGAFRLSKGMNIVWSGIGVLGLLFLSTFTVYEFNEIASEYMTRGARKAAIEVKKIENEVGKLEERVGDLDAMELRIENELSDLQLTKEKAVEEELYRHKEENEKIETYYSMLLSDAARNSEFPIFNAVEEAMIVQLDKSISESQEKLIDLRQELARIREGVLEAANVEKRLEAENINKKIDSLNSRIENINRDKDRRIREVEGGIFRSAESRIADIQKEYMAPINSLENEKDALLEELAVAQLREVEDSPEANHVKEMISLTESELSSYENEKNRIQSQATQRMNTPEFQLRLENSKQAENNVYSDRQANITSEKNNHDQRLLAIEADYTGQLNDIESRISEQSELLAERESIFDTIQDLRLEAVRITEDAAEEYEKIMYYRMASWFSDEESTGFGVLPQKQDYNRALRNIFLPIGIFFAAVSIVLAYVGTGFMFEESKKYDPWIPIEKLKDSNNELSLKIEERRKKIAELESEADSLRAFKADADEVRKKAVEKVESRLKGVQVELREKLDNEKKLKQMIEAQKVQLEKNERDLLAAKRRVFDAIKSIPQTITILDNSGNQAKDKLT